MRTDLFDFELPEELVALHPAEPRDSARMLTISPDGSRRDLRIADLPGILRPGDVLVVNDTRVIPAALEGARIRDQSTARVTFNLVKRTGEASWRAFARPAKRTRGWRYCALRKARPGVPRG